MKKERKPNEPLLDKQKVFLQVLINEHCTGYDSVTLNEFGEIELITGTTWKWLAKLIGKVERISFMDICFDVAESIAGENEELLNQIQRYLQAYAIGGSKSELISRLLIANEIGVINFNNNNEDSVHVSIPHGLFMIDVSTEYVDKQTGKTVMNHPNMREFYSSARRR